MIALILFQVSLVVTLLAALALGGTSERIAACAYAVAALASVMLRTKVAHRYQHVELGLLGVDLALFVALLVLSIRSDLWWLLCATALQLTTVLGHVAKILKPETWPLAYAWMVQASSFPSLVVLAIGIAGSRRRARSRTASSV